MKMFSNDVPHIVWAKVRNGKLVVWTGKEEMEFRHAYGRIVGIAYKVDEWNGQEFELVLVHLVHDGERWILSMRTDSQYFRSMVNYLFTAFTEGVLSDPLRFAPHVIEKDGKKYSAMYVSSGDKYLRAYFGRNAGQGLPEPIVTTLPNGKKYWDFSPQTKFYKEFLAQHFTAGWGDAPEDPTPTSSVLIPPPAEDPDDLPF